jgi:hypothetical protein
MVKEYIRQKKIQFEKKKPNRKRKGEKNFSDWKISQPEKKKKKNLGEGQREKSG